jgi:hypothetical protein
MSVCHNVDHAGLRAEKTKDVNLTQARRRVGVDGAVPDFVTGQRGRQK